MKSSTSQARSRFINYNSKEMSFADDRMFSGRQFVLKFPPFEILHFLTVLKSRHNPDLTCFKVFQLGFSYKFSNFVRKEFFKRFCNIAKYSVWQMSLTKLVGIFKLNRNIKTKLRLWKKDIDAEPDPCFV